MVAWVSLSALVVAVASGAACGSSGDDGAGSTLSGTGTGTGSSSGTGAGSGSGGGLFDGGSGSGDGAIDPDAAGATGSEEATLVPVNMLVMFDKSGSMDNDGKWPNATGAMIAFFQDPSTAGLRIALRFFPDDEPVSGCNENDCSIDACASPLVPIAPVTADPAPADAQEQALVSAINATSPGGPTPMFAALGGAEQWAIAYQAAHATEKVVVVLVTDGEPNGCNENIADIAALAADALASGVLTYTVGLQGSNQAQMDQIAQAGGTNAGFYIGNGNAQADLLAALKAIQGSSVSCNFAMPQSSDPNKPIDPAKINVNYTPGGGMKTTLGQVPDAAACGPSGGWYYDDPASPTQIILCPATCGVVQADPNADIEILIGCATEVGGPA